MEEIIDGVFIETGYEGVNVGAILVDDQLFCIDAPSYPRDARHWTTILGSLHRRPARYLLLTDSCGDRIINSRWLNTPIITHQQTADMLNDFKRRYPKEWLNSLAERNPDKGRSIKHSPIETPAISFSDELQIVTDSLTIYLRHQPGPTPASFWVHLRERNVLFTGDSFVVDTQPVLEQMLCGEWLASLTHLSLLSEALDFIIPGRGPLCTDFSALPLMDYLEKMRMTVQNHINAGKMRESLTDYVDDFVDVFPSDSLPVKWIRHQIVCGLDRLYQELILNEIKESPLFKNSGRNR